VPDEDTGRLARLVATARAAAAAHLARRFEAAGADDVMVVGGRADGQSYGRRLRDLAAGRKSGGLVVLGSGSIPLATDEDLRSLLATATSGSARALTNNRHSSDVVALGDVAALSSVPDLPGDNSLPRWLQTRAGIVVEELPDRARLGLDIDSPLDLELVRRHAGCPPVLATLAGSVDELLATAAAVLDRLTVLAADPRAELLVAGRLSAAGIRALETGTACRIRAIAEERGLRASSPFPDADAEEPAPIQRHPVSIVGLLLDRDGPESLRALVERLAEGAVLDSRVLLAHRCGVDEAGWPSAEDRFASDLLRPDLIGDPWLRELTAAAVSAPATASAPIALGGHTLVGPGLGLALGIELAAS
jgi:CTP:molybdopterin cytidylyltransferase MocA